MRSGFCRIRDKDTVLEAFEKNLSFQDGKYLVHLPWKEQHGLLPDNFENCVARLSSQLKRLREDPEILKEYDSIIQDQLPVSYTHLTLPTNREV